MGLKIAIGGKGGVGKTTVCAIWSQLLVDDGFDVLAIDADPNTNLAMAFGLSPDKVPEQLINMKELIAERTGTDRASVGAYFKLNPEVSDIPEKYWIRVPIFQKDIPPDSVDNDTKRDLEVRNEKSSKTVKLLVLGGITQAGSGCACPDGAFLKALLTYAILQRQEIVMIDLAAGVEFMGRASIQGIDALVVITEPGARSIETANRIASMAKELGIKHTAAVINKITDKAQLEKIKAKLTIPIAGSILYNLAVQEADLNGISVFEASPILVQELRKAKDNLQNMISD